VGVVKVLVSDRDKMHWSTKLCAFLCFGYLTYIMILAIVNTICSGCVVTRYNKYIDDKIKREYVPPPIQEEEEDDWDEDDDEDSSFN